MNAMYENHFGFTLKPFGVTSDPSFLYLSRSHREALDAMRYGVSQRMGFIQITGEIGCGKTTLCRALLDQESAALVSTAYIFNSNLTESQFLHTVVADFGIPEGFKNRHQLFAELNKFLIHRLAAGQNAVLIIDEAQNLSIRLLEQIRMLSNLETHREKLLQIILVGQPELETLLQTDKLKQLRQRIAVRAHLDPLSAEETGEYIHFRLQKAGAEMPDLLFGPDTVALIHRLTGGYPRVINLLCEKALLAAYAADDPFISTGHLKASSEELALQPRIS